MPVDLDGYGWAAHGRGRAARGEGKGRGVRHRAGMEVWSYGAMELWSYGARDFPRPCSSALSAAEHRARRGLSLVMLNPASVSVMKKSALMDPQTVATLRPRNRQGP
jgi:hypothetical protein